MEGGDINRVVHGAEFVVSALQKEFAEAVILGLPTSLPGHLWFTSGESNITAHSNPSTSEPRKRKMESDERINP